MSEVDWFRRFPAGGTEHRRDQQATPQATVAFSTDHMKHHDERKGRVRKLSSVLGRAGLWLAAAGVALVLGLLVLEWVARLVVLY